MGPFDTKCITGIPLLKQAKPYQSNHLDHLVLFAGLPFRYIILTVNKFTVLYVHEM